MHYGVLLVICCTSCTLVDSHLHWGRFSRGRQKGKRDNSARTNTMPSASCDEDFVLYANKCVEPFSKKVTLYTTARSDDPFVQKIFLGHVCRQYKKMLLCLHTSLTNCPTTGNMEIVQRKLGQSWVNKVNTMCNIQSDTSTPQSRHQTTSYTPNTTPSKDHNVKVAKTQTSVLNSSSIFKWNNDTNIDNTKNSLSAESTGLHNQQTERPKIEQNTEKWEILQQFLQFQDEGLLILYKPHIPHSSSRGMPTKIPTNHKKIFELDINPKHASSFQKWLYIVINASNLNTLQVSISSSKSDNSDGIGSQYSQTERQSSAANYSALSWHILLIITVISFLLH